MRFRRGRKGRKRFAGKRFRKGGRVGATRRRGGFRRGGRLVRRANGRRRVFSNVAKQSLISKKEIEVNEVRRFVIGGADVTYPTRDAHSFHAKNMGPRQGNMMKAFQRIISQTPTALNAAGLISNQEDLGVTGTSIYPFNHAHDAPMAIRSHAEVVEICNLNKFPVYLTVGVWKWKKGMNYQGGELDTEVLRGVTDSGGMLFYDGTNQQTQWNSVLFRANQSNANAFTIESMFGQRKTVYDRILCRKTWGRKVIVPASGIYKFKVVCPRIWPVYPENATALEYLCKGKVDWCLSMNWQSACGLIPVAATSDDPANLDIHTEKVILACRIMRQAVGVRYAYEPFIQVVVRDPSQFTTIMGARTNTNRAQKPQVHKDGEIVTGVPGQSTS